MTLSQQRTNAEKRNSTIRRSSVVRGILKSFAALHADTPEQTARTASRNCSAVNFRRCFPMSKGSENGKCRLEWQVIEKQKAGIKRKDVTAVCWRFVIVLLCNGFRDDILIKTFLDNISTVDQHGKKGSPSRNTKEHRRSQSRKLMQRQPFKLAFLTVSYTHLTLPTSDLV